MAEAERNKEGLTFEEWHTATGQVGSSESLVKAWKNGEDPSEYRVDSRPMTQDEMTQDETMHRMFPDLSPGELADLVGLVVTRMKLNSIKMQIRRKREKLDALEELRLQLIRELEKHNRGFIAAFDPIPRQPGEKY